MSLITTTTQYAMDLQASLKELGPEIATFKPSMANFFAGIVLGLLTLAAGIAIIAAVLVYVIKHGGNLPVMEAKAKNELSWFLVGLSILMAVGLGVLGFSFLSTARSIRGFALYICEKGFVYVERRVITMIRWQDVACITETAKQEHFPLKMGLKYLAPMGKSYSYVVRLYDGKEILLDGNRIKQMGKLQRVLAEQSTRHGIEWEVPV